MRSIVIHGHFYQPPRENPWLEEVEREASAAPHHDWNARIEQECYRAVVAARVLGPDGRITRIVNTLEYISFNFGPTLLEWLEHAAPDTYARVLDADRRSLTRLGHGNAIAQPYHHAILPLSSRRDKVTEVRWGIADFRRRFGRDPEGMWLPETAIDDETLDVLAQEGIRFTIVAPGQVRSTPNDGHPGRYTTSNGRTITLCIYDGDISHGIAFGGLLRDANVWEKRLLARGDRRRTPRDAALVENGHWEPDPESDGGTRPLTTGEVLAITDLAGRGRRGRYRLVSAATDGETYGHHHRFAEMALARVVLDLQGEPGVCVENFASYLANHPAADDVQIMEPSAWSCAHGVERWRSDCGCRMREGTSQAWRAPLRDAIASLAEGLHDIYDRGARRWFDDPWAIRDAYGEVVATPERVSRWVAEHISRPPSADRDGGSGESESSVPSPESLLEMERGALRIFTSCAWFFDDIAGLEPIEVLRYAARAIELAGPEGTRLEEEFLARLATARSNEPAVGTGRDIYLTMAKPRIGQMARLAGSVAAARATAPDDGRWRSTSAALEVHASPNEVAVRQRRTGVASAFSIDVTGIPSAAPNDADGFASSRIVAHVRDAAVSGNGSHAPLELTLDEMTERQHDVVVQGVRRRLVAAAFGSDTAIPRNGELATTLSNALLDAIARLANERADADLGRIAALLDLLELEKIPIPFDAQTRFHDAFPDHERVALAGLTAIAVRLGFATEAAPVPQAR